MERLDQRLEMAQQALTAFDEVLAMPFDKIVRDAAIQRFEFTVEAIWKLCQLYLYQKEGLEFNSPKSVFRGLFQIGLLNETQVNLALKMIDDRNLTVHTYNEVLAQKIYKKIPEYQTVMHIVLQGIKMTKSIGKVSE